MANRLLDLNQGGSGSPGVPGPTGAQGPPGATGIRGITGFQGPTGASGITGANGVQGSQGLTGVKGLTGTIGPAGSQGLTGEQPPDPGITGVRGITGTFGATGFQGITGVKGLTGAAGPASVATGLQGPTGIGPTGAGPTGVQGLTGIKGITGAQPTGVQGITGDSPIGAQGNTGVKGLTGGKGATGAPAITGVQGLTGEQGVTGVKGSTGSRETGVQGITGFRGITGFQGLTGVKGITGFAPTGVQGLTGALSPLTGVQGVTGAGPVTGVQGLTGAIPPALETAYVEQMTTQTVTGNTDYATAATLSSVNFVAGRKYFVIANALQSVDSTSGGTNMKLFHGSTVFAGSHRFLDAPDTTAARYTYTYFTVWTAAAGESITLQFNTDSGSNVARADQITIFTIEISERLIESLDWFFDEADESTDLDGNWTGFNNAELNITPANSGDDWFVMTESNMRGFNASNSFANTRLRHTGDSDDTTPVLTVNPQTSNSIELLCNFRTFSLTNALNYFAEQSENSGTQSANARRTYSGIFAINLSKFRNHLAVYTDAQIPIPSTNFGTTVQSGTINPNWDGKTWALSAFGNIPHTSSGQHSRLQTDGVDTPAGQTANIFSIENVNDSGEIRPIQFQVFQDLGSKLHTFTNDAGTSTANEEGQYRQIVAFTTDLAQPIGGHGGTGAAGVTPGVTGVKGATGAAGVDGATGITGIRGITGTLPPGFSPTGFQPTGIKGLTGGAGIAGNAPTGQQPTGIKGLTGAAGIAGNAPTGASPTGVRGLTGVGGITGTVGITGISPTGISPTGPKGITGVLGITGLQGITGFVGITGNRDTGVGGQPGVKGLTGVQGITGNSPTGAQPTGVQGLTGFQGITGVQSITGSQGLTGAQVNLDIIDWNMASVVAAAIGSGVDGYAPMPRFGTIIDVIASVVSQGTSGTTIVDVLRGTGTLSTTPYTVTFGTIFTTAGNRPMIGAAASPNNRSRDAAAPNITAFKKGDVFGIQVTSAATAASGLRVELIVQYTGT